VIRVAAIGDVHMSDDARGTLHDAFARLPDVADVLLLAGDLTRTGTEDQLQVLLDELDAAAVPQFAVLGNHDFEADRVEALVKLLERNGVRVLEGDADVVRVDGATLGIAGTKGFGGGFAGACGSDFGEPEMKAFVHHTRDLSDALGRALDSLDTDVRVALTHFSPVADTLAGEPPDRRVDRESSAHGQADRRGRRRRDPRGPEGSPRWLSGSSSPVAPGSSGRTSRTIGPEPIRATGSWCSTR